MSALANSGLLLLREVNATADPIGGLAIASDAFGLTTNAPHLTCGRSKELRDMAQWRYRDSGPARPGQPACVEHSIGRLGNTPGSAHRQRQTRAARGTQTGCCRSARNPDGRARPGLWPARRHAAHRHAASCVRSKLRTCRSAGIP